jgi:hypothetical protein
MFFLFSGEGPTDLGACELGADECQGNAFEHGPLTSVVDQIVERRWGYSLLESGHYGYVSKHHLVKRASELKAAKKSPRLPGKKQAKETAYFYRNARALALCSKEKEAELDDEVIAVLFRDSDGTASADRGQWDQKWQSMLDGFQEEDFERGVPMIPKPKSEAWIICAIKRNPYRGCNSLEDMSGNDNSPNSLKGELEALVGHFPSREELVEMVTSRRVDVDRNQMPSFIAFRKRLEDVLQS